MTGNFIKTHPGFLERDQAEQIISHFNSNNYLNSKEESDFLEMKEVLDQRVFEKVVGFLNTYKPLSIIENFETLGETLRFAQQCCFIYSGSFYRELQLACASLSTFDKILYSETKEPIVIKIGDEEQFVHKVDENGPRNMLDFLVIVQGDQININFRKQENIVKANPGELVIIPHLWKNEFTVESQDTAYIMLYRIAVDPSRYEIVDF